MLENKPNYEPGYRVCIIMPKHTKKRKNAKNRNIGGARPLIRKMEEQEYAQATKLLGGSHVECTLFDGHDTVRLGVIRTKLKRRRINRIQLNGIILVSLRDFQDTKVDIIHVYTPTEISRLRQMGDLPSEAEGPTNNLGIVFEEEVQTLDIDAI